MSRRWAAAAALVVAGGAVGLFLVRRGDGTDGLVASGTLEATEADLGFQVAGRVEEVVPREGTSVPEGEELAWLERTELEARLRAAEAQARAAGARLAELERGYRAEEVEQGRAALRAAERQLADARRDLERTRRLHEGGAVSRQGLDDAETALELAEARHREAAERLRILESGPRREQIEARRGALAQAEAEAAEARAILGNAVIRAPFDGVVTVRHREPGETVSPGSPVLTLMNPADRWVRIFVREDAVGRVSLGQRAEITTDSFRDRVYAGEVTFIADEAEFTPRNVQTAEERVKLVFEVKVRVTGDEAFDLKPGLPADVRLLPEGS